MGGYSGKLVTPTPVLTYLVQYSRDWTFSVTGVYTPIFGDCRLPTANLLLLMSSPASSVTVPRLRAYIFNWSRCIYRTPWEESKRLSPSPRAWSAGSSYTRMVE